MTIFKKYIMLLVVVLNSLMAQAQIDDSIRNHIIVSIDKAGCSSWSKLPTVVDKINKLLTEYRDQSVDVALYRAGDYLSFVEFRANTDIEDMSSFASSVNLDKSMSYLQYSSEELDQLFRTQWLNIAGETGSTTDGFSLVSVAKPYSMMAAKSDKELTNRTFLILVTDHHYNGNDFYDEIIAFTQKNNHNINKEQIFKLCHAVEQEYYIKHLTTENIYTHNTYTPNGYIELYEFLPLQQHISLISILDYPPIIKARKISEGRYKCLFEIKDRHNERFKVKRVDIRTKTTNEQQEFNWISYAEGEDMKHEFIVQADERPSAVNVRAWVNLHDGFYNATVLTPSESAMVNHGRDGLNISIPIEYEPDAMVVFDQLPLSDYFISDNLERFDQYSMANIVNIIMLLIVVCLVRFTYWVLYRLFGTYKPTKKNTKITQI